MPDERDPNVSQRYRDLGTEEPPRELDETILAAARRAADKPHAPLVTPGGRHRWYFSLGAAAVIVLAVAVTYEMQQEVPDPDSLAFPPVLDTQQAPAPAARSDAAEAAGSRAEETRAEQPAPAAAPAAKAAKPMQAPVVETPERMLERIVQLRKEESHDEADRLLAEFRRRYPDYRLSDAMLGKVEKK